MTNEEAAAAAVVEGLTELIVGQRPNCLKHTPTGQWPQSKQGYWLRVCPHCFRQFTAARLREFWGTSSPFELGPLQAWPTPLR